MSIEFHCSDCSKKLRVADGLGGKRCKCPSCGSVLTVPAKEPDHSNSVSKTVPPANKNTISSSTMETVDIKVEIACPQCQSLLLYSPELEGTRGLCKACQHIFTISLHQQETSPQGTFAFQCPKCNFLFEGKRGMEGRKGKCSECNEVFQIQPMKKDNTASEAEQKVPNLPSRDDSLGTQTISPKLSNPLRLPPQPNAGLASTSSGPANSIFLEPLTDNSQIPMAVPAAIVAKPERISSSLPNTTAAPAATTWDLVDIPSPVWTAPTPASFDTNPYASPNMGSVSKRSSGRRLTISNCFKLVNQKIWPILGWSLAPTGIMMGIALVEYVLAILGVTLIGAVVLGSDPSNIVAVGIVMFLGALMVGFVFAIPYFLVLPSYWQIALDGIRGRKLSFECVQKGAKWSGWLFLCFFSVFILRVGAAVVVGVIGGAITQNFDEQHPSTRMAGLIVDSTITLLTLPVHMIPIALADGLPFSQAISTSTRYVFGNFWKFIGLSLTAGLLFFVPAGVILGVGGLLSAFGSPVFFVLALIAFGLFSVVFFPAFYACFAAFYVLAQEND